MRPSSVLSAARRAARPARTRAGRSAATRVARTPSAGASGMPVITDAGVVDRRIVVYLKVWYARRDGGADEMRISCCPGTIVRI